MNRDLILTDGAKSIPLNSLPREAWTEVFSGRRHGNRTTKEVQNKVQKNYEALGIVNRCVNVRATTLAAVPWAIYRGEETFISSTEQEFPEGYDWLETLSETIYLIEASMTLLHEAFLYKVPSVKNKTGIQKLQWLQPDSMYPVWDETAKISSFIRKMPNGEDKIFKAEDILYIWRKDPLYETSPAVPPALAAFNSANILGNYDEFVSQFFKRGAVKATILKVDRGAKREQRQALKDFWRRLLSGTTNAWTTEVVSSDVEPIVVGEGVSEVDDGQISMSRKQDIATTMGVPHSILFSNAATYSTANVEERNFYTYTIIPEALDITRQLNEKIFRPMGLRFAFEWQRLDIFQASAKERAEVFAVYTNSRIPPSIAAQIAGIEMPEAIPYEELDRLVEEERKARMAAVFGPGGAPSADGKDSADNKPDKDPEKDRRGRDTRKQPEPGKSAEWVEESGRFERWAKKRMPLPNPLEFSSDVLNGQDKEEIIKRLIEEDAAGEDNPFSFTDVHTHKNLEDNRNEGRSDIEAGLASTLYSEFLAQLDAMFSGQDLDATSLSELSDPSKFNFAVSALFAGVLTDKAVSALEDAANESAMLGMSVVKDEFAYLSFDWGLVDDAVVRFAEQKAAESIAYINATTRKAVQREIASWIGSGQPLSSLKASLQRYFSQQRASLIAATEVTRIYAQSEYESLLATGLFDKIKWNTSVDELVCPVCGPLHNTTAPIKEKFPKVGLPPAHPGCRCWITAAYNKEELLAKLEKMS